MDVLVSLVNLWTEIKFLVIWGTCKTSCKRKEEVKVDNLVEPMCFIVKPRPLPIQIWLGPWYSSAFTFRLARSVVRWWVALESGYQLRSKGVCGVVRSACILEKSLE